MRFRDVVASSSPVAEAVGDAGPSAGSAAGDAGPSAGSAAGDGGL